MPPKRESERSIRAIASKRAKKDVTPDASYMESPDASYIDSPDASYTDSPSWFLDNCLFKSIDWETRPESLLLVSSQQNPLQEDGENMHCDQLSIESHALHAMDAILFEPLMQLRGSDSLFLCTNKCLESDIYNTEVSIREAVGLALFTKTLARCGVHFLQAVVKHLARSLDADLIMLSPDDRKDLLEGTSQAGVGASKSSIGDEDKIARLVMSILGQLRSTRPSASDIPIIAADPLSIAYLSEFDCDNDTDQVLLDSIQKLWKDRNFLLMITPRYREYNSWSYSVPLSESRKTVKVAPWRSNSQASKLQKNLEDKYRVRNIRKLQRCMRQCSPRAAIHSLATPYSDWSFLESSDTERLFASEALALEDVDDLISLIKDCHEDAEIKSVLLGIGGRLNALRKWDDSCPHSCTGAFAENASRREACAGYSPNVQKVIETLQKRKCSGPNDQFYWEQTALSLLLNPEDLSAGWSDTAINTRTQEVLDRILRQHREGKTSFVSYGLLKNGHGGGALIYGPSGTGKTQLARTLAFESKLPVLSASSAELENKYIGESAKAIKGLFNLGRMLAPSIIFIDEADALFRSRRSDSMLYKRDQVSQLLAEMDGITKSENNPLVLLSTNYPGDMDPAVLRRVPNHIYMGPPSATIRTQLFKIFLRDEVVSEELEYDFLALMTTGYSGSDIRSLCQHAAMMCDTFVTKGELQGKRLFSYETFKEASKRIRSTISRANLSHIKSFAKENDPLALQIMQADEADNVDLDVRMSDLGRRPDHPGASDHVVPRSKLAPDDKHVAENSISDQLKAGRPSDITSESLSGKIADVEGRSAVEIVEKSMHLDQLQRVDLYAPLMQASIIRVLSILPKSQTLDGPFQVQCVLEEVDLDDTTTTYQAFQKKLPTSDNGSYLHSNRERRALWDALGRDFTQTKNLEITPSDYQHAKFLSESDILDQPLTSQTGNVDRFDWGDFVALSYVWGEQSSKREITLNGRSFYVGQNLFDALLQLQNTFEVQSRGIRFWIDAICINQNDIEERATEVQKMGMIYSEALTVHAWLGNPSDDIVQHVPLFRTLLDTAFNDGTMSNNSLRQSPQTRYALNAALAQEDQAYMIWVVLDALVSVPYWERLWIIQEMSLASSIVLWYGNCHFVPAELTLFLQRDFWHSTAPLGRLARDVGAESIREHKFRLSRMWNRLQLKTQSVLSTHTIVQQGIRANAHEQKDKVYGLLGILHPSLSGEIVPDYNPSYSISDCWTTFTMACYRHEQSLNLLARLAGMLGGTFRVGSPTWAFDMSNNSSSRLPDFKFNMGKASTGLPKEFHFSEDQRRLSCKGVVVDTVSSMSTDWHDAIDQETTTDIDQPPTQLLSSCADPKLSFARVMAANPTFEFEQGLSFADLPWFTTSQYMDLQDSHPLEDTAALQSRFQPLVMPMDEFRDQAWQIIYSGTAGDGASLPWAELFKTSGNFEYCLRALWKNEDFNLQGIPLRDYFTSTADAWEYRVEDFDKVYRDIVLAFGSAHVFQTVNGRIGNVVIGARPGDKIVVLGGCDTPICLRKVQDSKEWMVVGAAYVDGLMLGEAGEMVQRGVVEIEDIVLC